MSFVYDAIYYIGYFWLLLVFLILSVIFAKNLFSWILYSIGAIITFISLSGNQKTYSYLGFEDYMTPYWVIYFILLGMAATIIIIRYSKANNIMKAGEDTASDISQSSQVLYQFKKCTNCRKAVVSSVKECDCGCMIFEEDISYPNVQLENCEMCKNKQQVLHKVKIVDDMGTRYRKVCDECLNKYNCELQ